MSEFRQIGAVLAGVIADLEMKKEAGGPDWRHICGAGSGLSTALTPEGASGPETTPARRQAWKQLRRVEKMADATTSEAPAQVVRPGGIGRRFEIIAGGRTVSHAAADRATPRPAVRLRVVMGGRHSAASR